MISLKDLSKQFQRGTQTVQALQSVTLRIPKGKIFTLLGPNGAGKTTMLSIIATLVLPTAGSVTVGGTDAVSEPHRVRRLLGLGLGGERSFYYRLTGRQNLLFFAGLAGLTRQEATVRAARLLSSLRLSEAVDAPYMKYSTGMKKKLVLARALLTDAPVLVLDEPTSGIDPQSAREIREMVANLRDQGRTILVTTHDLREAELISDLVGVLHHGRMLAVQTVQELRQSSGHRYLRVRVSGGSPEPRRVNTSFQHVSSNADRSSVWTMALDSSSAGVDVIVHDLVHHGVAIEEVVTDTPSLEEVFLQLTRG